MILRGCYCVLCGQVECGIRVIGIVPSLGCFCVCVLHMITNSYRVCKWMVTGQGENGISIREMLSRVIVTNLSGQCLGIGSSW